MSGVSPTRYLSVVAGVSLVYDTAIGIVMLAATGLFASLFNVALPTPILFAKLLGIFLICVGLGYTAPWRDPVTHRGYLWVFGPLLKGAGAAAFIADYFINAAPPSFLLFAASDATLALATLWGLLRLSRESSGRP
jgi:hypothetical protein